jgi:hypothetical protein
MSAQKVALCVTELLRSFHNRKAMLALRQRISKAAKQREFDFDNSSTHGWSAVFGMSVYGRTPWICSPPLADFEADIAGAEKSLVLSNLARKLHLLPTTCCTPRVQRCMLGESVRECALMHRALTKNHFSGHPMCSRAPRALRADGYSVQHCTPSDIEWCARRLSALVWDVQTQNVRVRAVEDCSKARS